MSVCVHEITFFSVSPLNVYHAKSDQHVTFHPYQLETSPENEHRCFKLFDLEKGLGYYIRYTKSSRMAITMPNLKELCSYSSKRRLTTYWK